jgi:uncharacterized protein YbbK (DUF523 family)
MAIGLGVPREPIQLVRTGKGVRVTGVNHPEIDVTRELEDYGTLIAAELVDICGYIFKARSPSCGIEGVATWTKQGRQSRADGTGAYAAALLRARPGLPVTDEVRLQDPLLREQFIEDVFSWRRRHSSLEEAES